MRAAARRVLGFVAVWPLVTLGLQAGWDVDPWKLMSFGMYAVPSRRPRDLVIQVEVLERGAWRALPAGALPEAAASFAVWRQTLGELVSPLPLVREVLSRRGAERVRLTLHSPRLDASTGRRTHRVTSVELAR